MRKDFGAKPFSYPQPVLIIAAYGEDGTPNAMNAAWGGISDAAELTMCLNHEHRTVKNILARGAFTVSMADVDHVAECDYLGITSGNKVENKLEKAGFHTIRSKLVDAPVIEELPMALECRLKSYDCVSGHMVGEIVNVSVDERVLAPDGGVDVDKLAPITFDPVNSTYLALGRKVGDAFKIGGKLK